uniref:DUF6598 domain-containing protein n=2 Tax=Aegilops tauschii subsp. strangulata TaxID=200361 RepID=A0A453AUL4_AEGTS
SPHRPDLLLARHTHTPSLNPNPFTAAESSEDKVQEGENTMPGASGKRSASEEKTLLSEPELMSEEEALLADRELTSEEEALLVGRQLMSEEKPLQADPELMFEVDKARQVDLDVNLGRVFTALMPLLRNIMPQPTLREMTLLTEPEPEPEPALQLEEVLLPELELTLQDDALHMEPVTDTKLTLEENAQQMRLVAETETESDTESDIALTLEENAQQMKLVTDTETETGTGTGTETESESESELALEEMLMMIEPDPEMTEEEKALRALHIVCCKEFTEYDPRKNAFVCTRFNSFNIAFFDLNEESAAILGPPLKDLPYSQWEPTEESSVNVISLKINESDVPYPINIFGTVLARDEVDYKCVYLFRRERDDSQCINSEKDMLTLTGPSRGFVVSDTIFFEINLKIKGDNITGDRDFSKGVIEHYLVPFESQPATSLLHSWLSTVDISCGSYS